MPRALFNRTAKHELNARIVRVRLPEGADSVEFTMPNDPGGAMWGQGCDPHTVTAYVSLNTGKALAVLGNATFTYLAVVDIEGMLKAPRIGNMVDSPFPPGVLTFVKE